MKNVLIIAAIAVTTVLVCMTAMNTIQQTTEPTSQDSKIQNLIELYSNDECTDTRAAECAVFVASIIEACVTAM